MQPKRHAIDGFIGNPLFCHFARSAAVVESIEALARRDTGNEEDESATPPAEHAAIGRFAALRAALRLPLPRVDNAAAYAALLAKAVTIVTVAWRRRARGPRLDPAVGALRNTGLFLRPHAVRARDDAAGGAAGLVPAESFVATSSPKQ
jgi:hypothetical protein